MFNKESEGHNNPKSTKQIADTKIRSNVISLIEKDMKNHSQSRDNALVLSKNFHTTQTIASTLALKSAQEPGNRDELAG